MMKLSLYTKRHIGGIRPAVQETDTEQTAKGDQLSPGACGGVEAGWIIMAKLSSQIHYSLLIFLEFYIAGVTL